MKLKTITLYREDSTTHVIIKNVKHIFWTAGGTVLVIAQVTDKKTGAHHYLHWPRERICWFKDSGST